MGEESDRLVRAKFNVKGEAEFEASKSFPRLLTRFTPAGLLAGHRAKHAMLDRILDENFAKGKPLTEQEAEFVREVVGEQVGKFARRARVTTLAAEMVEEQRPIETGTDPLLLPEDAFSPVIRAEGKETSEEWVLRYWDDIGFVEAERAVELYARVLAREATKPGAISMRTLGVLRDLDKETAEAFQRATALSMQGILMPIDQAQGSEVLRAAQLSHLDLLNLGDAGLLNFSPSKQERDAATQHLVRLAGQNRIVRISRDEEEEFPIVIEGYALTRAGSELSRLLPVQPDEAILLGLLKLLQSTDKSATLRVSELPSPWWEGSLAGLSWEVWCDDSPVEKK